MDMRSILYILSCCPSMLWTVSNVVLCCWRCLAPLQRWHCPVVVYPHVLQVLTTPSTRTSYRPMIALTLATMGTCTRALGIGEPCCVGRPATLFFMLEANRPQEAAGHAVAVCAALLVGRQNLEPLDMWRRQSLLYQGGGIQSH
jgi:hypothetical protein